jgi:alkylation response protein AidB-like acyl-CoA dehydrogenase
VDLTYTQAEEDFRGELRSWLQANIPQEWTRPGFWDALDDDESFRLRRDWERDKALAGFAGIQWPTEFGGRGGTPGMKAIYDEETVRAFAPRTVNPLGLTFLAPTVMAIGTEAQKKEIIGPMLRNEVIWCQGFSEPGAGSDLAALSTRGVPDGDDIVVNGQTVCEKHSGISMLLIDMHQPGVDARPLKQMSGASEFGEVFFTDARVPSRDCLGRIGDGWRTAMLLLSFERGASGISQYTEFRRQYDEIVEVARKLGRDQDPIVRSRLAAVLTDLECLRLHAFHVLTEVELGHDLGFESSMTKLIWSEAFQDLFEVYDLVLGEDVTAAEAAGIDLGPLNGQAMWSRSVTIWGGSSQVQRTITAERVLGLPR